jgi:hypothetical protein
MSNVTIACANPGGVIIGLSDGQSVTLNGAPFSALNDQVVTEGFGFTEVDSDFWSTWSGNFASSALLTSGAVWEVT